PRPARGQLLQRRRPHEPHRRGRRRLGLQGDLGRRLDDRHPRDDLRRRLRLVLRHPLHERHGDERGAPRAVHGLPRGWRELGLPGSVTRAMLPHPRAGASMRPLAALLLIACQSSGTPDDTGADDTDAPQRPRARLLDRVEREFAEYSGWEQIPGWEGMQPSQVGIHGQKVAIYYNDAAMGDLTGE